MRSAELHGDHLDRRIDVEGHDWSMTGTLDAVFHGLVDNNVPKVKVTLRIDAAGQEQLVDLVLNTQDEVTLSPA